MSITNKKQMFSGMCKILNMSIESGKITILNIFKVYFVLSYKRANVILITSHKKTNVILII